MIELTKFEDLRGWTLSGVENVRNEELVFTLENGQRYKLHHDQDCCENVRVEDIVGNLEDLVGSPISMAEEKTSQDGFPLYQYHDSFTWTFYRVATAKGYVTIRWYGESNGYYSESVDWAQIS